MTCQTSHKSVALCNTIPKMNQNDGFFLGLRMKLCKLSWQLPDPIQHWRECIEPWSSHSRDLSLRARWDKRRGECHHFTKVCEDEGMEQIWPIPTSCHYSSCVRFSEDLNRVVSLSGSNQHPTCIMVAGCCRAIHPFLTGQSMPGTTQPDPSRPRHGSTCPWA